MKTLFITSLALLFISAGLNAAPKKDFKRAQLAQPEMGIAASKELLRTSGAEIVGSSVFLDPSILGKVVNILIVKNEEGFFRCHDVFSDIDKSTKLKRSFCDRIN